MARPCTGTDSFFAGRAPFAQLVAGSAVNQVHHEVYTTPPTGSEVALALAGSLEAELPPSASFVTGATVVRVRLEVDAGVTAGLSGRTSTFPIDTGQVAFTQGTFVHCAVTVVVLVVAGFL